MNHSNWKRAFYTITAGQTVSLIGSSAVQFALIWWLSSETASPMMLAFSGLMAFLPQMLLGPFAGVWIDRWKRKNVVMLADLFQGVVAAAFAGWFLLAQPPYWTACVVLGIRAIGGVFHTPAIQALIPLLVPEDQLVRANGVSQFLQSGAFMLGPVLGAVMFGGLPMWLILLTDFLGAIAACGTMAWVKIKELPAEDHQAPHFWKEMRVGMVAFWQDKRLLSVLLTATATMVFFMPLSSYYPLMSSSYFRVSAWHGSLVELLYAAGMMAAALVIGAVGRLRSPLLTADLGLLLVGVTSLVGGLLPPTMAAFWIFAAACGLMGAGANIYGIPIMAYMQENITPEKLGRVFSMMGSLMSVSMPVGLLISGPVAEAYGVALWFAVTGVATCVLVVGNLIVLWCLRHRKNL